jgi:hypothetical protein
MMRIGFLINKSASQETKRLYLPMLWPIEDIVVAMQWCGTARLELPSCRLSTQGLIVSPTLHFLPELGISGFDLPVLAHCW